jgi:hypothetical protein
MILLGCLLAFSAAVAPRLVLILAWIFSDRWQAVWQGDFLMPLLGIIFLPYTTIMYMLAWSPAIAGGGNIEGWDWLWIILGVFLDIMKWGQMLANRKEATSQAQRYYPSGAPRNIGASAAAVSSGSMPPSTSPSAPDADTSPTATPAPPPEASGGDGSDAGEGDDKPTG